MERDTGFENGFDANFQHILQELPPGEVVGEVRKAAEMPQSGSTGIASGSDTRSARERFIAAAAEAVTAAFAERDGELARAATLALGALASGVASTGADAPEPAERAT